MKKPTFILILLIPLLCFTASCGKDGKTGNCYISVSKGGQCITSYWDDNSCLPNPCAYDQFYGPCTNRTSDVQTFNYKFYFCSGNGYVGTYTIGYSLADGTKGGFMSSGNNGQDKYFTLTLASSGLATTVRQFSANSSQSFSPQTIFSAFSDTTKTHIDTLIELINGNMHIIGNKIHKLGGEVVENKMLD